MNRVRVLAVILLVAGCVGCGDRTAPPTEVLPETKTQPSKQTKPTEKLAQDSEKKAPESVQHSPTTEVADPLPVAEEVSPTKQPLLVPRRSLFLEEAVELPRHQGKICAVAISPDGKWIASADYDLSIQIANAKTGELEKTLTFSKLEYESIERLVFSPDSKFLAAFSAGKVKLWGVPAWNLVNTLPAGEEQWGQLIGFTPSSDRIITQTYQKLHLVEIPSGKLVRNIDVPDLSLDDCALSPDGKYAARELQNNIELIDLTTGKIEQTLEGHQNHITAIAFSVDGKLLASAGYEDRVLLWDWKQGKILQEIPEEDCYGLSFSPDGKMLAVGYRSVTLYQIDGQSPEKLASVSRSSDAEDLQFSSDGTRIVFGGTSHRADLRFLRWSSEKGQLAGEYQDIEALAISSDERWLAALDEKQIHLWDLKAETKVKSWSVGVERPAGTLDFSPDGRLLAFASRRSLSGGSLRLWQIPSGELKQTWSPPEDPFSSIEDARFTPDGKKIFIPISGIDIYDVATEAVERNFELNGSTLRFSSDGSLLVGSSYGTIHLYKWPSQEELRSWQPHRSNGNFALSSDNTLLATCGWEDPRVKVWNIESGEVELQIDQADPKGVLFVAISQSGEWLLTIGKDDQLKVWSMKDGRLRAQLPTHQASGFGTISEFIYFPKTDRFLTAGKDKTMKLWDLELLLEREPQPPEPPATEEQPVTGGVPRFVLDDDAHDSIAFSPDGTRLASLDFENLYSWDVASGQLRWKRMLGKVNGLAYSPDGKLLATSHGDDLKALNENNTVIGTVRLWDAEQGKVLRTLTTDTQVADGIDFSPDGKFLAVASGDAGLKDGGELSIWNVETGKLIKTLPKQGRRLTQVRYSPDGRYLAFSGFEEDVFVWDLQEDQQLHQHSMKETADALIFSPDGKWLAACGGDYDHGVYVWNTESGELLPE